MDLVHLRTFLAVVEHHGFRRAAARLYLSQPAVSRHVAELERSVGVPLLERTPDGSEPTAAGCVLAERAQDLFDEHEAVLRAARSVGMAGDLVLAMMPGGAAELTGPLLRHLDRALPGVRVHVRQLTLPEWPSAPVAGVDLFLIRDPIDEARFRGSVVVSETMALAVPTRLAAADAQRLTIAELFELPFARLSDRVAAPFRDFWTMQATRESDARFRGTPRDSPEGAALGVALGDGVAFATPMVVRQFAGGPQPLARVEGAPPVRLVLASDREDKRPLIDAVHREAEWVVRRLGPLVLPELAEVSLVWPPQPLSMP